MFRPSISDAELLLLLDESTVLFVCVLLLLLPWLATLAGRLLCAPMEAWPGCDLAAPDSSSSPG